MRSLSIAASGMLAQQTNVEVISNNVANMNTTGYKRQRAEFQDMLYTAMERVGSASSAAGTIVPAGVEIGTGVKTSAIYRIAEQGNLQQTGNTYDLAINGRGYFRIQLPDGTDAFTRAGNFAVNAEGQIVTQDGYVVQPGITVPGEALDIAINEQGQVQATLPGQTTPQVIGQFELASFVNTAGLQALGDNLFAETAASGPATTGTPGDVGFGRLQQRWVESSNVNPVQEISALIMAQRAYEMNSRVISASDEMMQATSNLR